MSTTNENLNSPISGQFRSSPFYLALGAPVLAAVLSIATTALTYRVLPETVARDLLSQINPMILIAGGSGGISGTIGMVKRGLYITEGKIAVRRAPKLPDTVNAGGDVTVNAPPAAVAETGTSVENPLFVDSIERGEVIPSE